MCIDLEHKANNVHTCTQIEMLLNIKLGLQKITMIA